MSDETETSTQTLDRSSDTTELRLGQQPEMDTQANEASTDELTLRSVDERIKQATDPNLRRVEELCALLAGQTMMESGGNSEASGSRRNNDSFSPLRSGHDTPSPQKGIGFYFQPLKLLVLVYGTSKFSRNGKRKKLRLSVYLC